MAMFSRRKKTDDATIESQASIEADASSETPTAEKPPAEQEQEAAAPAVNISVQAFRGVGAAAGPEVSLPDPEALVKPAAQAPQTARQAPASGAPAVARPDRAPTLPLAPALPPEQTESVAGMKDNVLLRNALAELTENPSNEQLIGVLRQMMQNHLYLRVHGDARAQLAEGKPLSIAVVRDGERSYMLAFSSAAAVRESVQRETAPTATSAIAQPVTAVLHQLVSGDFAGLILDNASGAHRAVFPIEVLKKALEQADTTMTIKMLLAAPREADSAQKVGDALATTKVWVAVNDGGGTGNVGIAEARSTDGRRFLQVFTHPLEIVALGRGDKPMPFEPEQLAKVLAGHNDLAGVVVDSAGPSMVVEREALGAVLVRAVDVGE